MVRKYQKNIKLSFFVNAISDTYREFKNAIKYGRDTLTPEIVIASLRRKDMEMQAKKVERKSGEVHMMRCRSQFRTRDN